MRLKIFIFGFLSANFLICEELTLDQAVLNSPFKIASLGFHTFIPNENAILIRGQGNHWNQWYKVNLINNDTILFIDSTGFKWKESDIFVNTLSFSEDGKKILIGTDKKKLWRHSFTATFFVYDVLTKLTFPISSQNKNLRNAKFSPNGKFVSYIRNDNNIYVFNIEKRKERKLTTTGNETLSNGHFGWLYEEELTGYDGYRWSPDSEYIAFWEEEEKNVPEFSMIEELTSYPGLKKIRYPKVGETNPSLRIGIIRIKGSGRKWIKGAYVENDYLPWMEWVNKDRVAYMRLERFQKSWDIFVTDKKTGKSIKVLTEFDAKGWLDNHQQIRFLNDGRIVWVSEKSGYKHLWISKHSGSKSWPITEGKWEVSKIIHIDEDEEIIYFMSNKQSVFEHKFFSVRYDGTGLKLLTPEDGNHSISLLGSKLYFLDTFSSLIKPKTILLKELKTGKVVRTVADTDKNQFKKYGWKSPQIIQFPTLDSLYNLDGLLLLPKDYTPTKKYPLIVYGYGMPGTQIVWNKWGSLWSQFLSQQGYIVFSMDSRGMGGRGEEFKNFSYGDMSKFLSIDHIAGVKQLIKLGYVDPNRVGAWGWSGGGYFTCLMLTRNSDYFKAGVAVAPCTDFRLYDTAYTERYMGDLNKNKSGYDSTSVLSWIHRMKGSILIMHGSNDDNVHLQHTSKFVNQALLLGKDVEWYNYPGKDHGIYGGGARKHLYRKMIDYFNRRL
ncbi:MAG: hypothetical protein CMF94_03145 [Candidatus Marinimicrobia bacterium]|nr:hypothetical protein [Candidatus Neomarinimicrobiota bacterium]